MADRDATIPGTRVLLDLRGLEDPERAPTTASYLDQLLRAFAADPLPGESFAIIVNAGQADPTSDLPDLRVAARRRMPPTRLLRSAALTLDPFLLRAAAVGTSWRVAESGASGAVYHAIGGPLPLASGLPVVVSLLDLAPFELPGAYQRSVAAQFGQRLRTRLLHDAAAVLVSGEATARAAIRLLHLHRERIAVVPLAAAPAFRPLQDVPDGVSALADERSRLGLPDRYVVFFGRYDARRDLGTLMEALGRLRSADRPGQLADAAEWPPRVLLVGANPDDRSALARAAERWGVGDLLSYAPFVDQARLGLLVAGARLALVPALSEATGLAALEALAAGTPVVASAVGALPEVVGAAGILVEPRDPDRLAAALEALWVDGRVHDRIGDAVARRLLEPRRTWADVARETRLVYARAAASGRPGAT